jgi:hypothetical protein
MAMQTIVMAAKMKINEAKNNVAKWRNNGNNVINGMA